MEKQLGWGGMESLEISKVGQTVLARLMEFQIWHQVAGSVGERFRQGTVASAHLDANFCHMPLVPLKLLPGAGAQRE